MSVNVVSFMLRTAKILGLCLALCVTPWNAQSTATAAIQTSLTIRESCLVQITAWTRHPRVSCLHGAPYLTRLMAAPLPMQDTAPSKATPAETAWLVMF